MKRNMMRSRGGWWWGGCGNGIRKTRRNNMIWWWCSFARLNWILWNGRVFFGRGWSSSGFIRGSIWIIIMISITIIRSSDRRRVIIFIVFVHLERADMLLTLPIQMWNWRSTIYLFTTRGIFVPFHHDSLKRIPINSLPRDLTIDYILLEVQLAGNSWSLVNQR